MNSNNYSAIDYLIIRRDAKDNNDRKQKYIQYFTCMENKDARNTLSKLEFHWVQSAVYYAVKIDKCFMVEEIMQMFPNFCGDLN